MVYEGFPPWPSRAVWLSSENPGSMQSWRQSPGLGLRVGLEQNNVQAVLTAVMCWGREACVRWGGGRFSGVMRPC